MTSAGRMSAMKRDISVTNEDLPNTTEKANEDALSTTSAKVREREIKESTSKV